MLDQDIFLQNDTTQLDIEHREDIILNNEMQDMFDQDIFLQNDTTQLHIDYRQDILLNNEIQENIFYDDPMII